MRRPSRLPQPMDPKEFYILLALSYEPMHGYAIQRQIELDSRSALHFYPASFYRILERLHVRGLIEVARQHSPVTYSLTERGRRTLKFEADGWRDAGRLAQQRLP